MTGTVLDQILDYWKSVSPDGGIPSRSDINPAGLKPCLPHIFLFDIEAPDLVRVRIFGTKVVEWLGLEPTGKNLLDHLPEHQRETYLRFYSTIIGQPCGAIGTYHMPPRSAGLTVRYLHLPLLDAEGRPRMIIGGADYASDAETERHLAHPISLEGDLSRPHLISLTFLDLGFGVPDSAQFQPDKSG